MEIICPRCNRKAKIKEEEFFKKDRKKVIVHFPCYHYADLVYDVPIIMDNNTIVKDFQSISKEYFNKTYYLSNYGNRCLNKK